MNIIVVGTGWGQVHLAAYTEEGHRIIGLVDLNEEKRRNVCRERGIPHSASSLKELIFLKPDLISIAVPAPSHFDLIFQAMAFDCPIVCEKPILGSTGSEEQYNFILNSSRNIFFNYAYPNLVHADRFDECIKKAGPINTIEVTCLYNMDMNFSDREWWFETICHQIALMVHIYPDLQAEQFIKETQTLVARSGGIRFEFRCQHTNEFKGLKHTFIVRGKDHYIEFQGIYIEGNNWHYTPVKSDGNYIGQEEWPVADPWYTANRKSLANIIKYLSGNQTLDQALALGAFNPTKAMKVEKLISAVNL